MEKKKKNGKDRIAKSDSQYIWVLFLRFQSFMKIHSLIFTFSNPIKMENQFNWTEEEEKDDEGKNTQEIAKGFSSAAFTLAHLIVLLCDIWHLLSA